MRPPELWTTSPDDRHTDKKARLDDHAPVRSSPRFNRTASDHHNPPFLSSMAESPRKRKVSKPVPQPSPRMATRSSTRHDPSGSNMTLGMESKHLNFGENLFSPSTMFGTSPAQPLPNPGLGVDTSISGNPLVEGELDIESILNQLVATDGQNGFSLDALFANSDMNNGGLMDLLNAWDEGTKDDSTAVGAANANANGDGNQHNHLQGMGNMGSINHGS